MQLAFGKQSLHFFVCVCVCLAHYLSPSRAFSVCIAFNLLLAEKDRSKTPLLDDTVKVVSLNRAHTFRQDCSVFQCFCMK